jgi:hypothetical protein
MPFFIGFFASDFGKTRGEFTAEPVIGLLVSILVCRRPLGKEEHAKTQKAHFGNISSSNQMVFKFPRASRIRCRLIS